MRQSGPSPRAGGEAVDAAAEVRDEQLPGAALAERADVAPVAADPCARPAAVGQVGQGSDLAAAEVGVQVAVEQQRPVGPAAVAVAADDAAASRGQLVVQQRDRKSTRLNS